jgi:hypothetical protein
MNTDRDSPVQIKVKLSLFYFNWAPRHEGALGEWRYSFTHSLTSAQDGGEWSASLPGRFTPTERAPDTHWRGGWVDPRAVLEAVVRRKISLTMHNDVIPRHVRVNLSLCLIKHHAMKTYGGVEVHFHAFLNSVLEGDEWLASRPGRFIPGETDSGTQWIGGWVGPSVGVGMVVKCISFCIYVRTYICRLLHACTFTWLCLYTRV